MSYDLEAFLVPISVLSEQVVAYPLTDELGLVPLTLDVQLSLGADWAEETSRETPIARVSAGYFGGAGSQSATVWSGGEVVAEGVEVNEALRRLGVVAKKGMDEWDTVGLGRFRRTSSWTAQALREKRLRSPDPLPALLEALRYESPDRRQQEKVRALAAEDLGKLRATEAIPALVRAVEARGETGLRISAASALARIGAITELARLLAEREPRSMKKRDPHRFFPIVHALGEAGAAAAPVAAELARMLDHWHWGTRIDAAHALEKIGPGASAAVPALRRALEDEERLVRAAARAALHSVDPARWGD